MDICDEMFNIFHNKHKIQKYLFKCAKLPEHKSNSNPTDTGQWAGVIVAKLYKLKSAFGHYHKLCTVSWR